jgi:hypothetical protein
LVGGTGVLVGDGLGVFVGGAGVLVGGAGVLLGEVGSTCVGLGVYDGPIMRVVVGVAVAAGVKPASVAVGCGGGSVHVARKTLVGVGPPGVDEKNGVIVGTGVLSPSSTRSAASGPLSRA